MPQTILTPSPNYSELDTYLRANNIKHPLLICGNSINLLEIGKYFDTVEPRLNIKITKFTDFQPNPAYESVVKGVQVFRQNACDCVIAVGGGSAMDVAKCIKMFATMNDEKDYVEQTIVPNDIKLLAVPTTAGTGSEATRYAVIYYKGEKYSVTDNSCIPSTVLLDASVLKFLPEYQRKATMLDAFCHAVESYWSVNSTNESKAYSGEAIQLLLANKDLYLANDDKGNENMLMASNLAGKAINITQTTAGHAMCYKLTTLYGIAHGHAAALCVARLWPYMILNCENCIDSRGIEYLRTMFDELAKTMGCEKAQEAAELFRSILSDLHLEVPIRRSDEDYEILKNSVNPVRLKNNPVKLDENVINDLYHAILK